MQDLLDLAFDDPVAAVEVAEGLLAAAADPLQHSFAHQALGIVLRESGDVDEAVRRLRMALRSARSSGSDDRLRDVRATYGGTLVVAGMTRAGLRQLVLAENGAVEPGAARVRVRRAAVLAMLGRHAEAGAVMRAALEGIAAQGDREWEARGRVWLAHIELRLGNLDRAEDQVRRAAGLFEEVGAGLERITAEENLAEIALARGDLARSLDLYARAWAAYELSGRSAKPDVVGHWATAYLAAGLADEAVELLDRYLRQTPALSALEEAEMHLRRSIALSAAGDAEGAYAAARLAADLFRRQRRDWFATRARLAAVEAGVGLGKRPRTDAVAIAAELDRDRADEAPVALVLAGRLSRGAARVEFYERAAAYHQRANPLVRASAYLGSALARDELDDRTGVLRACAAGVAAIDEHRRSMGSSELRALASTHGRQLTEIAVRHAVHHPRTLLRWSERTRATSLAQPPATSDAASIPASLAALRDNGRRLVEARQDGVPTEDLEKEQLRLERAVRAESHTISAAGDSQRSASVEEIVTGVGDGCLVELVDVDGVLHVLVVHNGRVRRKVAGSTQEVADLLGPTSMLLRRAARGRPANTADIGRRLQDAILGDAVRLIPDGPVTLAPTARLHGLAWSLLPTLHDRAFGIVPSAGQWLRANERKRPTPRRTLLVAGPDLESGGAEVPVLAKRHPDAVLLDGRDATLAAVLDQLDGADLAHLATHGRFRADSPLFSALDLADGPLTVHDLERLKSAPYRVVLSACESGVLAPVGAEELLGLAAALFSLGTAGLVSSVAEVNDRATAELMVGLHDALARGEDPAHALLEVRRAAAADPVAAGTAAAFLALGV
ncbi:CHAT domain-containing protein [Nocardioides humilatus]|uniref:CHAT domain-containing protein n=1 Tax=Nocardioides humilatus TaxID=2607660 RepID=A0A5B1LHQ8_9ACTN|nr:CHAT domain-containing protein [Nocardioides humilatus]KAA1420261.1 CHAT domain-containing protein [Nocardioides humilatus]